MRAVVLHDLCDHHCRAVPYSGNCRRLPKRFSPGAWLVPTAHQLPAQSVGIAKQKALALLQTVVKPIKAPKAIAVANGIVINPYVKRTWHPPKCRTSTPCVQGLRIAWLGLIPRYGKHTSKAVHGPFGQRQGFSVRPSRLPNDAESVRFPAAVR